MTTETTATVITAPTTLKDLRRSERAIEKTRNLVAKQDKALADAEDDLDNRLALHAALTESYRIASTEGEGGR